MGGLPASLTRPQGHPDGVRSTATTYHHAATAVGRAHTALGNAGAKGAASLRGPRAEAFATASASAVLRVAALGSNLTMAHQALQGYGGALEAAQDGIDHHAGQWHAEQDVVDKYQHSEDPTDQEKVRTARRQQHQHESAGEDLHHELRTVAHRTATALDGCADALVPHGAGQGPEALLRSSMAGFAALVSPDDLRGLTGGGKTGFDTFNSVKDLVETPSRIGMLRAVLAGWKDLGAAQRIAEQTRNLEEAKIAAVVRLTGPGSMNTLRQWMTSRQLMSLTDEELRVARAAQQSRLGNLSAALKVTGKLARASAVLGIASGLVDIVHPSHDGARGVGDRIAGGLSVAGGTAILLTSAGLIALGPVGGAIVVGALAVAAAWGIGNLVVDHWDDIKKGLSTGAKWLGKQGQKVLDQAKEDFDDFVNVTKQVGGKIKDLAGGAKDLAVEGAKNLASGAKDMADGAKDLFTGGVKSLGGLL
jgi:X-X-X-Leu-X-X-Gly heptad repeat protein